MIGLEGLKIEGKNYVDGRRMWLDSEYQEKMRRSQERKESARGRPIERLKPHGHERL